MRATKQPSLGWVDRMRLERAVTTYDFWLETYDVPRRQRTSLRDELRANLTDSAALHGARQAVRALGSTRTMAADLTHEARSTRPRWTSGIIIAMTAGALSVLAFFFNALAWLDGVYDLHPAGPVRGSLTFWPASSLTYTPVGQGFSMAFVPGWMPLAIAAAAFLVGSRAWRVLGRPKPDLHSATA